MGVFEVKGATQNSDSVPRMFRHGVVVQRQVTPLDSDLDHDGVRDMNDVKSSGVLTVSQTAPERHHTPQNVATTQFKRQETTTLPFANASQTIAQSTERDEGTHEGTNEGAKRRNFAAVHNQSSKFESERTTNERTKRTNERTNERTKRTNERSSNQSIERTNERTNERSSNQSNERTNERTNKRTNE